VTNLREHAPNISSGLSPGFLFLNVKGRTNPSLRFLFLNVKGRTNPSLEFVFLNVKGRSNRKCRLDSKSRLHCLKMTQVLLYTSKVCVFTFEKTFRGTCITIRTRVVKVCIVSDSSFMC